MEILLTEPVVNPQVWQEVPDEHVRPPEVLSKNVQSATGNQKTQVAEKDQLGILGLVQRAAGVEVVDTAAEAVLLALSTTLSLVLVIVVPGDVGKQVDGPATDLLIEEVEGGRDGGFLGQFGQLVGVLANPRGVLFPRLGDVDHVLGDVAGRLVVLAVRDLPREVRDQEGGVADPTDCVVQCLRVGEGLVTALVSHDPQAGPEQTLDEGVERPQASSDGRRGDVLGGHVVVEEVEGGRQAGDVARDVVETGEGGAFEAVLGDSLDDVGHGVVWDFEVVAVEINHLGGWLLGLEFFL